MIEGLGEPKKTYSAEEFVVKKKASSPFGFAKSICDTKENLMVDDWSEKQYSPYIVNKHLSYGSDTVTAANEMNARPHIDHKLQYDFLKSIIRKKRRFNKWLKPEQEENMELVQEYFGYSKTKALDALRILSDDDLFLMRKQLNKGGKS